MHGNIGLYELHALVSPQDITLRMEKYWTETLSLCAPPALRELWTIGHG